MKVYRSGNLFKSARITGPKHHFLSVEFGQTNSPIAFQIVETQKPVSDQYVITCLARAVDACADKLPVQSIFEIKRLLICEQDRPDEEAYIILLRKIIAYAEEELEA